MADFMANQTVTKVAATMTPGRICSEAINNWKAFITNNIYIRYTSYNP
jgi:hypothetical protein